MPQAKKSPIELLWQRVENGELELWSGSLGIGESRMVL